MCPTSSPMFVSPKDIIEAAEKESEDAKSADPNQAQAVLSVVMAFLFPLLENMPLKGDKKLPQRKHVPHSILAAIG